MRGAGGDRSTYRPVTVGDSSEPTVIAKHLYDMASASACYIADLDALRGGALQTDLIQTITQFQWEVWLDAGIGDVSQYERHRDQAGTDVNRWIVALESLQTLDSLQHLGELLGGHGIFSIDLIAGQLRTANAAWRDASITDIAALAIDAGFPSLIVLDVRHVGMRGGNHLAQTLAHLRATWPHIDLISGGGIRDQGDLDSLQQAGCGHALIATALYDGNLGRAPHS